VIETMATDAPPAYEAPPTWENANQEDPGAAAAYPNLNASAPEMEMDAAAAPVAQPLVQPAVKYVDQFGNPVNPPAQAQANVKYVDQHGRPVNPPVAASNIKYVDQFGNPVAAPVAQQTAPASNIKYVDQFGRPVQPPVGAVQAQPAANIKYVDQFGNPVNPPAQAQANSGYPGAQRTAPVTVQAQPQTNVTYVNQFGQPVNPPATAVNAGYPGAQPQAVTNPHVRNVLQKSSQSQGQVVGSGQRTRATAAIVGFLAALLLFIGMCVDSLAEYSGDSDSGSWWTSISCSATCGWAGYQADCGGFNEFSYDYDELCSGEYTASPDEWCATQSAAAFSLVMMLAAFICSVVGVIRINPYCCKCCSCCKVQVTFSFALLMSLLSIIIWTAGDQVCLVDESELTLGGSMICAIIATIFLFIASIMSNQAQVKQSMNAEK